MSSSLLSGVPIRLPTASFPRLNFFANASFTIATFGAPAASAGVSSRPERSGMPRVRKKPGPISLKLECVSVSGPDSNPCTRTPEPQLLPDIRGTIDAVTLVTPGSAASSSSMRSKSARVCAGW
jgi:hypothetical protein